MKKARIRSGKHPIKIVESATVRHACQNTTPAVPVLKLYYKGTDREVQIGDHVFDFRNDPATVTGKALPHTPESTGRVYVVDGHGKIDIHNGMFRSQAFYPAVFDMEWRKS